MSRTYSLDTEAAKQSDSGQYISETGKYIGVFTRAEEVLSKKNTEGVEFAFKAQDGSSADFLTLWTFDKDGRSLHGFKVLNAIMTCMRVKEMNTALATVEKYDNGQRRQMQATVFPSLMNKPVGILLQKVWRADKPEKYKFEIFGAFDASSELTASEILEQKKSPERLPKMVAVLKDKHEAPKAGAHQSAPPSHQGGSDFADDIPF